MVMSKEEEERMQGGILPMGAKVLPAGNSKI
jgi:hypothetical protein